MFILLVFLAVLPGNAFAQSSSSIEARFDGILDSAMHAGAERNQAFNERTQAMNVARPLEADNLDHAHVDTNVSRVLEFISFLKAFRTSGQELARRVEDSLFVVATDYPPVDRRKLIVSFSESYKADADAFDKHLGNLIDVYSSVLDVLTYLQQAHYAIVKGEVKFNTKEDAKKYNELMGSINSTQAKLPASIAAARHATAAMNAKIDDLNGKPEGTISKRKRSAK